MNKKEWKRCCLLELAHLIRRGPFGGAVKKEIFVEDGFKVYEQGNAIYDDFEKGTYFIDEWKYKELSSFAIQPNDLLISCSGTIGRVAIVPKEARPGIINQALMLIRPNTDRITPVFLRRLLETQDIQRKMFGQSNGSTMKNVMPLDEIKATPIIVPPLPEQRRIATILDKADAIRRKREEGVRLTEELLRSTFLEMFGDPATNPIKPLAQVAAVVSGVTKGRKLNGSAMLVPYLRVANVQDGFLNLDEIKKIEALPQEVESLALQQGDIVMTEGGDHDKLGRGAIWNQDIPNCIHQNHVFRVRVNRTFLLPEYFAAFLGTIQAKRYFLRCAKKTTNLASINMTQLKGLPVPIPAIKTQREFEHAAQSIIEMNAARKLASAKAHQLFGSLVQRAFGGEL